MNLFERQIHLAGCFLGGVLLGFYAAAADSAPHPPSCDCIVCKAAVAPAVAAAALYPNDGDVLVLKQQQVAEFTGFRAVKSGAPAKQETHAVLYWDDTGLDVVFDCADSGIVAGQRGRDNIKLWKDDSVYLWLDPGHTHNVKRELTMVQVSAGGEWHDVKNGDPRFDIAGLVVETSRTGKGWHAHLKLPWKGLGVDAPKAGDVWGLNLTRMDQPGKTDYANMEMSTWVAIPNGETANLDRWGHLVFAGEVEGAAAPPTLSQVHTVRRKQLDQQLEAKTFRLEAYLASLEVRKGIPANLHASENVRKILQYLTGLPERQDKRVLLAQDLGSPENRVEDGYERLAKKLADKGGRWLPMIQLSYGDPTPHNAKESDLCGEANRFAKRYWQEGGMVTIKATPGNPWTGGPCTDLSQREKLPNLIKPGTPENQAWMMKLDAYAARLSELRDAGVVVLWRPLPEMTFLNCYFYDRGAVADPEVFKELWRHMFRYFSEEKKLDNLLWVYAVADVGEWDGPAPDSVYPGADYVDIVGISLHRNDLVILGGAYEKLTALGKPFAVTEFGAPVAGQAAPGKAGNQNLIRAIREKYPKTIYASYCHGWTGADMANLDMAHAEPPMTDPWIAGRDDLDWKGVSVLPPAVCW